MRAYMAVFSTRFRECLQYRAAAFAGFICQFFFGLVIVMVLDAFYRSSGRVQPMNFGQVVDYTWLGQAFLAFLPWQVDRHIREMMRNGSIAYEMVRPLGLYPLWLARTIAWRSASALLRSVPIFILTAFVIPLAGFGEYALHPPAGPGPFLAFAVSMLLAVVLSGSITIFMNITTIWTVSGEGISVLIASLVTIMSGMVIPLPLFPDSVQKFLWAMPFRGLSDIPFRYYAGNLPPAGLPFTLLHQIGWSLAFAGTGLLLLLRGRRRLAVQGG